MFEKKTYWSGGHSPDSWSKTGGSFYFPFAEQFLAKYPWLAVRIFWLIIKIIAKGLKNANIARNFFPYERSRK